MRSGITTGLCLLGLFASAEAALAKKNFSDYSDEALVRRLSEVGTQINARVNTGQFLMALRPDPAYVITSSTSFFGHLSGTASIYTMPRGYQGHFAGMLSGTASTTYSYYDVNSFSRSMNGLAQLINEISLQRKQREFQSVLAEIENRVRSRRRRVEIQIRDFFASNLELKGKEAIFAAALPWVVSKSPGISVREALGATKEVVVALSRQSDLTGKWYGVFAQQSVLESGERVHFNSFVVVDLVQGGQGKVQGQGYLGNGDAILVAGVVADARLVGRVENITRGYHTVFSAEVAADRFDAEFQGTAAGEVYAGRAILVR